MQIQNEFLVGTGIQETWAILTDFKRIAPCLPGATLEGRDGDSYLASVKVKVGPIGVHMRGSARFKAQDDDAYSATVSAAGKDPRGTATAAALIRFRLEPIETDRTRVLVDTELDISGRIAQFGRGAIADVSNRLLDQFVDNLSTQVLGRADVAPQGDQPVQTFSNAEPTTGMVTAVPAAAAGQTHALATDLDLLSLIVPQLKQRYGQAIIGALGGFLLSWIVLGRRTCR